jgi:hypothetical protein
VPFISFTKNRISDCIVVSVVLISLANNGFVFAVNEYQDQ